jgi:hypothetical protein
MADSKEGLVWTSLEHMNDMTMVLAALTQRQPKIRICRRSNKRQIDFPTRIQMMKGGVMFKRDYYCH